MVASFTPEAEALIPLNVRVLAEPLPIQPISELLEQFAQVALAAVPARVLDEDSAS